MVSIVQFQFYAVRKERQKKRLLHKEKSKCSSLFCPYSSTLFLPPAVRMLRSCCKLFRRQQKKIPPTKRWTGKVSMLLISCAAVPESIVKLRTGQDVAGVAVSLVGQETKPVSVFWTSTSLSSFLMMLREKLGRGIRFRTEQDTAEKFLFLSANTGRGKNALIGHDSSPFRFAILLSASEVWEPCCQAIFSQNASLSSY